MGSRNEAMERQDDGRNLHRKLQSDADFRNEVRGKLRISDTSADKARYNGRVRRVLSIVLLAVFSLPLISPVLALAADSDVNLPACCRRNGAHRCVRAMRPVGSSSSETSVSEVLRRCPAYPAVVTPVRHGDLSFHTASLIFAGVVSHPTVKPQTEARARVALDLSRQKRGPPAEIL